MSDLHAFHGPNAGYILDQYDRFLIDPESVEPEFRSFFATFDPNLVVRSNGRAGAATATVAPAAPTFSVSAVVGAAALTQAIREFGHLGVQLDPLGSPPIGAPELAPQFHGITEADLQVLPSEAVPSKTAQTAPNAAVAIDELRQMYTGGAGYDFDQVQLADERVWLREMVEDNAPRAAWRAKDKKALLKRLTEVEGFERFLHQTYLGQKRFSIEGTDALVPMLDCIVQSAAEGGVSEVVIGMAHRGRLNVLTHVLGKPYAAILAAFEGSKGKAFSDDKDDDITGDVKYHLGARLIQDPEGKTVRVPLVLAPNPSHLEFVDPVIEGMARASQDDRTHAGPPPHDPQKSMAIMLHGDAAFPGQGIVAETLNLSGLHGYTTGGTIHIIVNNQIGFTTDWGDARSTLYAGDLAKGFEIPVVHVNADDPEMCLQVATLAVAYRERFGKDFLIDLVGYRRWGHNEGDEPSFTQPKMYSVITRHPTVRKLLADRLVASNVVTAEEPQQMLDEVLARLAAIRKSLADGSPVPHAADTPPVARHRGPVETAIPEATLRELHSALHGMPKGRAPISKLARQLEKRAAILDRPDGKIDWGHAESLAFAAILSDGTPIRLSGQDAERGTFSHRHLVLHDGETGETFVPLQALPSAKASFAVYNSPLSEAACVGFEYGYTVHAADTLVIWEAQFGDFANGAQVLVDQFLAASHAKWEQDPSLVMLLPHGYEGQGPEHSSARLERYLQLAAEENLRVANCTTAAQYFHLMRRQAALLTTNPRPLIVMSPKSLLRHPAAASPISDFTSGTFQPVLDDPSRADNPDGVRRLVLCSGKIAVELDTNDARAGSTHVAIARVEQLAPFPAAELRAAIEHYPNLDEIVWVQEEPRNMGAWSYMEPRLRDLLGQMERPLPIGYAGRPERASPAEGSAERHAAEHARIAREAFAGEPGPGPGTNGKVHTAVNGAESKRNGTRPATIKTAASRPGD